MHILIFIIISKINLFTDGANIVFASANNSTLLQEASHKDTTNSQDISPLVPGKKIEHMAMVSPQIDKKNPNTALLLSILPGGGQFYTHNYLKGSAFALLQGAAAGATIYFWVKENKAKEENNSLDADYYYGQMYNYLWIDGFVWGFSMMDAYVSAHFYKFRDQSTASGLEIGFRF